jgi:hypothetical protein
MVWFSLRNLWRPSWCPSDVVFERMKGEGNAVHSGRAGISLLCFRLSDLDESKRDLWKKRALLASEGLTDKGCHGPTFVEGRSGVYCMMGVLNEDKQAQMVKIRTIVVFFKTNEIGCG